MTEEQKKLLSRWQDFCAIEPIFCLNKGWAIEDISIKEIPLLHEFIKQLLEAKGEELKEKYWKEIDKLQTEAVRMTHSMYETSYDSKKEAYINGLEKAKDLFNDF